MSINIALQGLSVAQRAFEITSNNIANVNTPGYSRQQVVFGSRAAPEQGVQIIDISRTTDLFATKQYWSSGADYRSNEMFSTLTSQIDDLLANPVTSISAAMDEFFGGIQTGVDDPSSVPNRELILAQSEALVKRFVEVDRQLRDLNASLNTRLQSTVDEVNATAAQVAELNDLIRLADSRGEPANELKDQRDELILVLSEKLGVSAQTSTGSTDINLFVGNGQPLVVGGNISVMEARQGDPDSNDIDIFLNVSGRSLDVTEEIHQGEVGGLVQFKDEVLLPTWNELGRLAIVFADTLNEQHSKGIDLDGNVAGNWFKDPQDVGLVKAYSTNDVPLAIGSNMRIADSSKLYASDYVVKFGEDGDFTVTRKSDGTIFTQDDFTSQATPLAGYKDFTVYHDVSGGQIELQLDGMEVNLSTASGLPFGKNDQVLVQPVRSGAELIDLELTSGRELAFASPVRAQTAIDNTGLIEVGEIDVNNRYQLTAVPAAVPPALIYFTGENTYSVFEDPSPADFDPTTATPYTFLDLSSAIDRSYVEGDPIDINGTLVPASAFTDLNNQATEQLKTRPMQLLFDDANSYSVYDMTDPANPLLVSTGNPYTEGQPIQLQGFTVEIKGRAEPGDKVNFGFNTDGVSDNRNALQLSNLQLEELVDGATYQDNYSRLIERVGTEASVAFINLQSSETIFYSAESVKNGISGVNLDEEAANLIKFQQQYQAASQVINTSKQLFDSLLSATA